MWIEAEMRSAVRSALPEKAFLRRDRGDGLFITNAPVFDPGLDTIALFRLEKQDKLMLILPEPVWLQRLEAENPAPADDLSASLMRFRGIAPTEEAMLLFCEGIKLLDTGASALPEAITAFDRALRRMAARALRGGCSGGGLYALSLLDARLKT